MTGYAVRISLDLGELAAKGPINETVFPHLSQAVATLTEQAYLDWIEGIRKARGVWSGDKAAYEKSLQWDMVSSFHGTVWTPLKLADEIETGRPPRDLKKMLDTSTKVRVNKKGLRYLIIPMQHNVPGMDKLAKDMPPHVYDLAKKMQQSFVVGQGLRPTGAGYSGGQFLSNPKTKGPYLVTANTYKWGDRLPAGLAPKLKPHHTTDIYAGMVRMAANTPKAKSSAYLTFRIMREDQSNKWIIPAKEGLFLAREIEKKIKAVAETAFQQALSLDMAGLGLT